MEPIRHITNTAKILNMFYEWPKTTSEFNIFFREIFKTHEFWPEMYKK